MFTIGALLNGYQIEGTAFSEGLLGGIVENLIVNKDKRTVKDCPLRFAGENHLQKRARRIRAPPEEPQTAAAELPWRRFRKAICRAPRHRP